MLASQRHTVPPFAGYPAYDETTRDFVPTPRPAPRVKPEAMEYALRNRSSFEFGFETQPERSRVDPSMSGRYSSQAGLDNLRRSRGTWTISSNAMADRLDCADETVRCRATKPEAQQTAQLSKGGRMNLLLTNYGRNEVTPRPNPRVKTEAASNYEMDRGGAMNRLLHDVRSLPATARPGPRVKPEAEMIALKNRGSMNSVLRTCTPRY